MLVQLELVKKLLTDTFITRSPFGAVWTIPVVASKLMVENALKRVVPFLSASVAFLFPVNTSTMNVGPSVGATVGGIIEGAADGANVGEVLGEFVGLKEGADVVGPNDGELLGETDGHGLAVGS
jgi:ABC-type uncharacterized transport system permease subunit